jgi:hypothetical protein
MKGINCIMFVDLDYSHESSLFIFFLYVIMIHHVGSARLVEDKSVLIP